MFEPSQPGGVPERGPGGGPRRTPRLYVPRTGKLLRQTSFNFQAKTPRPQSPF